MSVEISKKVLLDVDETLVNSVKKHVLFLNHMGPLLGWKNLPSYDEVLVAGGTHKAYGHFPHYWELNDQMVKAHWFNEGLEMIEGALDAVTLLQATVVAYLTTRPENMTELTHQQLVALGFPNREVIARPPSIPMKDTSVWKFAELKNISGLKGDAVVMVDDSASLHHLIKEKQHPDIKSVLYAGPMTPRGNGEVTWPEVPEAVEKA